jgi:hypothetical protein
VVIALCGPKGSPGLVPRGAYSENTIYPAGSVVSFGGSSFVAIREVPRLVSPTSSEGASYWTILASKGATGAGGQTSIDGVHSISGVFPDVPAQSLPTLRAPAGATKVSLKSGQRLLVNVALEGRATLGNTESLQIAPCAADFDDPTKIAFDLVYQNYEFDDKSWKNVSINDVIDITVDGNYRFGICTFNANNFAFLLGSGTMTVVVLN